MAGFPVWFYHLTTMFLLSIISSAWPLSVDLILSVITRGECLQPVVCKQDLFSQTRSLSVIITPNELFALGRAVHSVKGDIVLLSALSDGGQNYSPVQLGDTHKFDMCSVNCSTVFKEFLQRDVYIQKANNLSKLGRQSLYNIVSADKRKLDRISHSINSLISGDEWNTHILFTSSYAAALSSSIKSPASKCFSFILDNDSQLNGTLNSLYKLQKKDLNFIVVCSVPCILDVLNQVYHFETMFGKASNKWLVIPTTGSHTDIIDSSMQIPDADIVVLEQTPHRKEYLVLSLNGLRKLLSRLDPNDITKTQGVLTNYIDKTSRSVSNNVFVLNTAQKKKKIRLVGHISEDGSVIVTENLFPGFRYGFKNRTLTVSTLEWPPFVYKKEENGSISFSGVCIDLLEELSRALNFSYHIVIPEDGEWGRELNGRWTGLVGDMVYRKSDLVVAPLTIMESRANVMDFTVPYFYVRSTIMMKKQVNNSNKWMTLIAPFRYEVHICILFSLIFSTLFLFIAEEIHPVNRWTNNRLSARWTRYGNILWYHFGALMANGASYLPSTQTGRSVLSCWWFFTVICAAVYSGNLIAFLTGWQEDPPFTTLAQMVKQDTYKWGTLGGTSYIDLFKNSNQSVNKKIWHGLQGDSELTSLDMNVHIKKVMEGQYVYLGHETMAEMWKSNQCELQVIYDPFFFMNYAIGLPNNSSYTSLFTDQVLRINELGLPRAWYKHWSSSVKCETSRSARRVDLQALQGAFYAGGVGVVLCLFVLMAEVVNRRNCRGLAPSNTESYEPTRETSM